MPRIAQRGSSTAPVRAQFLTTGMTPQSLTAVDQLRAAAIDIKRFDSISGASPSLEEFHLPGGWVVGIVTEGVKS